MLEEKENKVWKWNFIHLDSSDEISQVSMKFHWNVLCIWYLPESRRLQKESCRRTISLWWLCCDKVKLLWTFNKRWRVKKPGELVPHRRLWFCLVWRRCDRFNGYMDDSWQQQSTVLHCPVVFRPRSFQFNLQRIGVYQYSTYTRIGEVKKYSKI